MAAKGVIQRCKALQEAGDAEGVLQAASTLEGKAPPAVTLCKAWALMELAQLDEARQLLEAALRNNPPKQPKLVEALKISLHSCRKKLRDALGPVLQPSSQVAVSKDYLMAMQRKPTQTRNICVVAHVDHGKTSLTDGLVASNRIISNKQVARLRYMVSSPS
eukprot:SAG31_NODE_16_length_36206_cov_27.355728_37_plen_162_part_00